MTIRLAGFVLALAGTVALAGDLRPGDLDPTFGQGGIAGGHFPGYANPFPDPVNDEIRTLALQTDGKVVVGGIANYQPTLARYDASGALDPTFGTQGLAPVEVGGPGALVVDADGRIVFIGASGNAGTLTIVRYLGDGQLDTTFGSGGIASASVRASGTAVVIQGDGRIVVVGSGGPLPGIAVVRFRSDGTLDPTFGNGGETVTYLPGVGAVPLSVTITTDRRIVVGGTFGLKALGFVARYLPDGRLDPTFGNAGTTRVPGDVHWVGIEADGKIIAGGEGDRGFVARLDLDGALDERFGDSGVAMLDQSISRVAAFGVTPEGGILASGVTATRSGYALVLARYGQDGAPDSGFGSGGIVVTPLGEFGPGLSTGVYPTALAVADDGRITVGGAQNRAGFQFLLVRYVGGPLGPTTTTTIPSPCASDVGRRRRASRRVLLSAMKALRHTRRRVARAGRHARVADICAGSVEGAFLDATAQIEALLF